MRQRRSTMRLRVGGQWAYNPAAGTERVWIWRVEWDYPLKVLSPASTGNERNGTLLEAVGAVATPVWDSHSHALDTPG